MRPSSGRRGGGLSERLGARSATAIRSSSSSPAMLGGLARDRRALDRARAARHARDRDRRHRRRRRARQRLARCPSHADADGRLADRLDRRRRRRAADRRGRPRARGRALPQVAARRRSSSSRSPSSRRPTARRRSSCTRTGRAFTASRACRSTRAIRPGTPPLSIAVYGGLALLITSRFRNRRGSRRHLAARRRDGRVRRDVAHVPRHAPPARRRRRRRRRDRRAVRPRRSPAGRRKRRRE